MRAVRCYRGTEWAQLAKEAEKQGLPLPPNPLQHTDARTTMRHYARKGAFDELEAARRIQDKHRKKIAPKAMQKAPLRPQF